MLLKLTKIRSYVASMKARGFSARAVLDHSGLNEAQLQDPAQLIEARQRERIVHNMLRLTGDGGLGLAMGASAKLVDFGILAHAQMSAANLREAFTLWRDFSSAVGTTVAIELEEKSRRNWRVIYQLPQTIGPVERFNAEEITASSVSLGDALMGADFRLEECTYAYPAPPHWKRYEKVLDCKVRFNASKTSVRLRALTLDQPLPGHDPEFHGLCVRYLHQLIRVMNRTQPTTERLRSLLLNRARELPDAAQCAHYLGMSTRSMRRRLQVEGTSFMAQYNLLRLDLARQSLLIERRTVKEIAGELGFRDAAAFRRAFKLWAGQTVGDYLAEQGFGSASKLR